MTKKWAQRVYYRGRVAMYAMLKAPGIGQNNEVALQEIICLATPDRLKAVRVTPLYMDMEAEGFNMSISALGAKPRANLKLRLTRITG